MPQTEGTLRGRPSPRGAAKLKLSSPSFADGATIPKRHTADGEDVSPMLRWGESPPATRALALTCEDPDAPRGLFVHWLAWDIEPEQRELPENVPARAETNGIRQGTNSFGNIGYGGPSPPPGEPHRYIFRLYALDASLGLPETTTGKEFERAIDGHILAEGTLVGKYGR